MKTHDWRPGQMGIPTCAGCGAMRAPRSQGGHAFDFDHKVNVSDDCDEARAQIAAHREEAERRRGAS